MKFKVGQHVGLDKLGCKGYRFEILYIGKTTLGFNYGTALIGMFVIDKSFPDPKNGYPLYPHKFYENGRFWCVESFDAKHSCGDIDVLKFIETIQPRSRYCRWVPLSDLVEIKDMKQNTNEKSLAELELELDRLQKEIAKRRAFLPAKLEARDWSRVEEIVTEYIRDIANNDPSEDLAELWDVAVEVIYGPDIWDWINERVQ